MFGFYNIFDDIFQLCKGKLYYNIFSVRCKICKKKLYLSSMYDKQDELSCENKISLNEWLEISHYKIIIKNNATIDERFFLKDYVILINANGVTVTNNKNKKYLLRDAKIKYKDLEDLLIKIKKYSAFY